MNQNAFSQCWAAGLAALLLACCSQGQAQTNAPAPAEPKAPQLTSLSAIVYAKGSELKRPLFKFKRQASRSGSTIKVLREYTSMEGKPVLREQLTYRGEELLAFDLEELQIDARGSATVHSNPAEPGRSTLDFSYTTGAGSNPKSKTAQEPLRPDTLIDDQFVTFFQAHWATLAAGQPVKSRYMCLPRRETIGFTFKKEAETSWRGRPALVIKMEPSSVFIAALVEPLIFTVEKASPHRVLQYVGRTAPKLQRDGKWHDLDAVVVFDWE